MYLREVASMYAVHGRRVRSHVAMFKFMSFRLSFMVCLLSGVGEGPIHYGSTHHSPLFDEDNFLQTHGSKDVCMFLCSKYIGCNVVHTKRTTVPNRSSQPYIRWRKWWGKPRQRLFCTYLDMLYIIFTFIYISRFWHFVQGLLHQQR